MNLGKRQVLKVLRIKDFGAYLGENENSEEAVLLPKKEIEGLNIGDDVEVFIYKDSNDRYICTKRQTKIELGQLRRLIVKDISRIGAFLDIGLERDILLPFKEMEGNLSVGDEILVAMYVDRSDRLAVTMRIYPYLEIADKYKKDDIVSVYVYRKKEFEYLVAIDDKYYGAISKREVFSELNLGDTLDARILKIREDKKIDLSPRKKAYEHINEDAKHIYTIILNKGGILDFDDKASPQLIKEVFSLSKSAFKRAIGNLLKTDRIIIENSKIIIKGD